MTDWTIPAVIAAVGLMITAAGLVAAWAIRINRGELADGSASKAHARIDLLQNELATWKQQVASEYASVRMIEQMENRLVRSNEHMEGRIAAALEKLGDRIDQIRSDRHQ